MLNNNRYRLVLNEDGEQQQSTHSPFQYTINQMGGSYYLVITIRDKSVIKDIAVYLNKIIIRKYENRCEKLNEPIKQEDIDNINKNIVVYTDNHKVNQTTEAVFINIKFNPKTIISKDGTVNTNDNAFTLLTSVLRTLHKNFKLQISNEEFDYMNKYFTTNLINVFSGVNEESLEKDASNLFFDLCKRLGEDEVRQWLSSVKVEGDEYAIDHEFSLKNKLKILAQGLQYGKTPTYLATEKQWWDKGRRVVDLSEPYYGVTINLGRHGKGLELDTAADMGYKPVRDDNGNITATSRREITNLTNGVLRGSRRVTFSYNSPYFDVSATEPIGGKDEITDLPAFSNNLEGSYNDPALNLGLMNKKVDNGTNDRTDALNKAFNAGDYEDVNIKYLAICKVARVQPSLPPDSDVQSQISECTQILHELLRKNLSGFGEDEGRMIRGVNRNEIIKIGTIILMGAIRLPMDKAPGIRLTDEDRGIINALSVPVFQISSRINSAIKKIKSQKKNLSLDETIKIFSPYIIYEEWFNNGVNIILENAKY